jgi:hypothetical protein
LLNTPWASSMLPHLAYMSAPNKDISLTHFELSVHGPAYPLHMLLN